MDPRSSYFHHTKYANPPSPSPTLPPPPPLYPNSLNFHHHINFLAPPPPQQQPRPPQTPQFSPRNLQFSYNHSPNHPQTHDNYHRQLSHHDLPHFTQLPRVSHQFNDERQPPRRLPEFDHRAHEPRPDFRFFRNDQQTRHELEGNPNPNPNSRLVQDRNILIERESEHYHIRGGFGSNSDRSYAGDFRTVANQVRGFESNSGNYENRRRLNYDYHEKGSENQRWFRDREVMIDQRDSSTEFGSNEIGDGETRIATGKREHYRSREGNLEVERHGNKRSREGSYEFNRTPRKQVQKKSALLRLQQPNYRNREDERVPYSGYVDDTKSSSFRGKDQESGFFRGKDKVIHTDCEMGEGEREGSPVELDVSFKSNSLVAKAILTPSSSSVSAFETILTPRNSKVRKVLDLAEDKDSNNSSMNKPNKVAVEVGKGVSVASKASSSDKDLKKSREGVIASGITNVRDSSSLPLKNRVEMPMKRTVSVRIGSSGKTSPLNGKKKKVVKRVVKKVVSHSSTLSSSQPTKIRDELVKADSSAHSPAEPLDIDKAATVADVVDSQPCPIEDTVIPENDRVERFEKFMESGQAGSRADSGNSGGKKNCSRSPLGSSNHNKTKFGESFVNGDCAKGLHAISNIDNSLTKPLDEIISSDIGGVEDFSKQPCQNGDSCSLENSAVRGSLKVMDFIEGNTDFGLLSLEKTIIHEDPPNSCIPMIGLDVSSINSQQRIMVSDKGTSDVGGNEPCRNQGSSLAESGITDLPQDPSFPVGSNEIFSVPISGETGNQNAVLQLNQGAGTILGSPNSFTNLEEINISGHGTGDGIGEELSQDGVAKTLNSVPIRSSLDTKVSTGGSEEDANEITKNDKKIEMPQLDLSRTDVPDIHLEPANMVTSTTAHWVNTTLRLCFEDDATDQCTFSGAQFVDAGSQSCSNVVSALHEGSLTDVSAAKVSVRSSADVGQSGVSRWNEKNRKSSVPQLELCSPVESDDDEGPVFAGNSTSGMEVPSNSCSSPTLPKGEVVVSDMDSLCSTDLLLAQKGITALLENGSAGEHFSPVASIEDLFEVDGLKDVQSHLTVEDLAVKKVSSRGLFVSGVKDIINTTPVVIGGRNQNDSMDIDAVEGAKVDINVAEVQVGIESVSDHCQIPSKPQTQYMDQILPSIDADDDGFHGAKNDSPCMSNNPSSFGDGFGVSSTNSGDELMEIVPETLYDKDSPETLPDVMVTSLSKNSVEKIHENNDKIPVERAVINFSSNSSTSVSSSQKAKVVLNLDHTVERDQLLTGKTGHLPSQDSKITSQMPFIKNRELYGKKNHDSNAVSKIYSGRSSFVLTGSKSSASSSRISKTRTWHRTDNCSDSAPPANKAFLSTVPALRQYPRKADRSQRTSYIRKGNSLVRKPTSVAQIPGLHGLNSSVYQLNSSGIDELKKSAGSNSRIDLADPPNAVRTGGMDASFEKPRTPSLSSVSKISNRASNSLGGRASSPLAEHLHSLCTETVTVPAKMLESNDIPKSSDKVLKISESPIIQNSQISNIECHSDLNDVNNMVLANGKSLTYVKRKSNQLVAASNPCASSAQNAHNTSSSDSYYKRRKNQLIRTSLESQVKQTAPEESLNSEEQTALNSFSRNFSKRRLRKVVTKTCKPSKLSLVWTLHGAQLSKNDGDSLRCGKVLPHLFPWKRATYRRSSLPNSSSISDHSSLSTIGRKLLLLRKRNTVYTRSKHGFSLRKSKVLSVGGSSLKWSKSIEKHSKKANEEATLAVAAAERKKREQRGALSIACPTKSRNSSRELTQRERIFRIGSVRYKMDSSRRTLQRISDDESSSGALQKEKDAKKMYIPRRLMIGKDEYVRIGNGNQLVRDPKKRTRILASEKVRWSLHTARSRLARKRKYCQFFTRFGKCNKDDGKCPFIHDSSKIAVCTKFLNGLCFNPDCKLTHKVIPERMPDCSYFLQGLCTNKNCPYRHVHVNPNASTCEGFLRGYCADGNECPKKHSYVCPTFEATGSCPQGSKCKLHHPKNRTKEKKCKRSQENNAHGRYFGLMHINATKMRNAVPGKLYVQDNDTICFKGTTDYISLDVSDEEMVENNYPSDLHTAFGDSDPLNLQLGDLDELIKPVRIMNI